MEIRGICAILKLFSTRRRLMENCISQNFNVGIIQITQNAFHCTRKKQSKNCFWKTWHYHNLPHSHSFSGKKRHRHEVEMHTQRDKISHSHKKKCCWMTSWVMLKMMKYTFHTVSISISQCQKCENCVHVAWYESFFCHLAWSFF